MENMIVLFFLVLVPGVFAILFIQPNLSKLIDGLEHSGARTLARFLALTHYICALTLMWFTVPEPPLGVFKHEHIIDDFLSAFTVLSEMPNFGPTLLTVAFLAFLGTHYVRLSEWLKDEMNRKALIKESFKRTVRRMSGPKYL